MKASVDRAPASEARGSACAFGALLLVFMLGCAAPAREGDPKPAGVRFSKRLLFMGPFQEAAVADFNNDGRLDIVSGAHWFAAPDYAPRTFRANEAAADFIRSNSDLPYDVDGDGWTDIVVGAWGEEGVMWYRNPGERALQRGFPWEGRQLWPTKGKIERTDFHDYDGDGVPEIQIVSYVKEEPAELLRLTKTADGAPSAERFVLGAQGGGHGYAWGDVNGDGREDFLTEIGWYERPEGDPFAGSWTFHPESALPHPSCPFAVEDVNGDGRLDILFGRGHDYGLYWREQGEPAPDGATTWKEHVIDESWSQGHVAALADLDGDGDDELITGKCVYAHAGRDPGAEEPAVLFYYDWDASTNSFERRVIGGPGEGIGLGRQIAIADLNSDGRLDLVAPGQTGLWLLTNDGIE